MTNHDALMWGDVKPTHVACGWGAGEDMEGVFRAKCPKLWLSVRNAASCVVWLDMASIRVSGNSGLLGRGVRNFRKIGKNVRNFAYFRH